MKSWKSLKGSTVESMVMNKGRATKAQIQAPEAEFKLLQELSFSVFCREMGQVTHSDKNFPYRR